MKQAGEGGWRWLALFAGTMRHGGSESTAPSNPITRSDLPFLDMFAQPPPTSYLTS